MKIKKIYNGVVPNGKILNLKSTSQNDIYSCSYINDKLSNNYSTEEQVIGKWMGKPLYRKFVNISSPAISTGGIYDSNTPNILFAYIENAFIIFTNGLSRPVMTAERTTCSTMVQIGTNGYIEYYLDGILGSIQNLYVIINYIKTTD